MERVKYIDPIQGKEMAFAVVKRSQLVPSPYQRPISTGHVSKLSISMIGGFTIPVIVVEIQSDVFAYVDGQHRIAAADKSSKEEDYEVPVIIVPAEFINLPLTFNIEKGDNIRDICEKVYAFYTDAVTEFPESTEQDFASTFSYETYAIPLAFAYKENNINSPSLVQPPVKKLEGKNWCKLPFPESIEYRRSQGEIVSELEDTVLITAESYDISDFQLKRAMISQASRELWGGKRKVDADFSDGIRSLIDTIKTKDWSWMYGR